MQSNGRCKCMREHILVEISTSSLGIACIISQSLCAVKHLLEGKSRSEEMTELGVGCISGIVTVPRVASDTYQT